MATVILVRHGRSSANVSGTLAGRLPGVELDEAGLEQAANVGSRLAPVPLAGIITSPLTRCEQTAAAIAQQQPASPATGVEEDLIECDYGQWQGRALKDLAGEDLWAVVQRQPSAAIFPGGESLAAMQARSVAAVRRHDAAFEAEHGKNAVWVAVSHGDLIKSILADALGQHLDHFQRIMVDPASVSIVRYTGERPYVLTMNSSSQDLSWLAGTDAGAGAQVGGGAGPGTTTQAHPTDSREGA